MAPSVVPNLLFDTCVFIDFLGGDPAARMVLATTLGAAATNEGFYSAWTTLELLQRPGLNPVQVAQRIDLLSWFRCVPMSEGIALQAAIVASDLKNGRPASIIGDAIIAQSALSVGASVVTRNLSDFGFLSVPVVSY